MNDQDHLKTLEARRAELERRLYVPAYVPEFEDYQKEVAALSFAISAIERSRWVAVETLPTKTARYLVRRNDEIFHAEDLYTIDWFIVGDEITDARWRRQVLAWMPIPPYTPKGEQK